MNRLRKISLVSLSIALMSMLFVSLPANEASALSGSQFNAGRIIDDALFYNGETMTASQIQDFLNAKVPTCDVNGSQGPYYDKYGKRWDTRADYGRAHGSPPPYTCLKSYKQDTGYKAGQSGLCSAIEAKSGRTAAQIIDDVARACHISQKVILVMLQKEQGLVTDDWPWPIQYRGAMGYGCPDTAACDSEYYGFFNQVYNAALQFQRYKADPNNWNHVPFMTNPVLYQAEAPSCGSKSVYIENYATAGLYNYTPYTPNQAALDNLYGTGDDCSAYGNRNFWRYYSDWFGSTHNTPYAWDYLSQQAYTDTTFKIKVASPVTIRAGERLYLTIVAKNSGTQTWKNSGSNPIRLGTSSPNDRQSIFCTDGWISCSRPALLTQSEVKPGQIGTFGFWIKAPQQASTHKEYFNLVSEGKTWLNNQGMYYQINVIDSYKWSPTSVNYFKDSLRTVQIANDKLLIGSKYYARVTVQNRGNTTWTQSSTNPVRLATSNPRNHNSELCVETWTKCSRFADMKESSVAPGGTATFEFEIKTPQSQKYIGEKMEIVVEGKRWMDSTYTAWMKISNPTYTWAYSKTQYFTDATKAQQISISEMQPNQQAYVQLTVKNTSDIAWFNNGSSPVALGTYGPSDRSSNFYDSRWAKHNRPARLTESTVNPGDHGNFEFWIQAPSVKKNYDEYFNLVVESKTWMKDMGLLYKINVK